MNDREKMKKLQDQRQKGLPEWNGYTSDLTSMQITKEELARKVAARQSSNLALARAEMLQKNRDRANPKPFSVGLSAQLRASSSKTLDDALADSAVALALAHKVKEENVPNPAPHYQEPGVQSFNYYRPFQETQAEYHPQAVYSSTEDVPPRNLMSDPSTIDEDSSNGGDFMAIANRKGDPGDLSEDPLALRLPLTEQGWENLNNTIQLVVKTCEALWLQLEDERINRQRLHHQLQEQRNVITTLTAELLQIQDHQETILSELHSAKTAGLLSGPVHAGAGATASASEFFQPTAHYQQPQAPIYSSPDASQRMRGPAFKRTGRVSPRPLAYSDSSLNNPDMPPRMQLNHRLAGSPSLARRDGQHLRYQGKSKSATQLDSGQDKPNYEKELASNVALLHITKNYHMSDH